MPFCYEFGTNNDGSDLQMNCFRVQDGISPRSHPAQNRRASCAASLSVEAALVMPLFVFALASLLQIMIIINTYSTVNHALYDQTMKLSGFTYLEGLAENHIIEKLELSDCAVVSDIVANGVNELLVKGMVENKLGSEFLSHNLIADGVHVVLNYSGQNALDVVLSYKVRLLFNIFGIGDIEMVSRARTRCWVGTTRIKVPETVADTESNIVYVTTHGTKYHTFRDCPYIDIKVEGIKADVIGSARNASGGKYYPCSKCFVQAGDILYITTYGDRYHQINDCSAIFHNVMEIERSEIGERTICSKCRNRGGN